ncbi:TetR/AcrR family transcriptional regulator [Bacillus sp. EB01]|uniref:TetR/AcrR family transcriptional regulator n=1 Tax=Bacillus sp. EB01 TaxID=1347086 RepID=UPI000693BC4F|nr:TetR/AcrR family transcriptional regulator [Bacillus sp. EB01]
MTAKKDIISDKDRLIGDFPYLPKQERARAKRDALLASGRKLFYENGYEQTSIKEIASVAGVATGTFYRYFHDKRQLLLSLLEDRIDKFLPPEPDWSKVDPVDYLAKNLSAHFEQMEKAGVYHALPELLLHDEELAELVKKARKQLYQRILDGVLLARQNGDSWNDLDPEIVASSILLLVEQAHTVNGGNRDYRAFAQVIYRLVAPPSCGRSKL